MRPDRVRLLTFLTAFGVGGTERQALELGWALDLRRFEVRLACLRRWGSLLGELAARGTPLTEYGVDRLYGRRALGQQLRFARDLRRQRIRVMHAYNFYPIVFAVPAARLARVPAVVVSIRDTGVYLSPWKRRAQRAVCRLAHRILVNAEAVRQWLAADGYDPRKIRVIRNGIDLSRFQRRGGDGALRRSFGWSADAPVVAVLARLTPMKGFEDFLDAAAIVARRVPEARFLIVGDDHVVRDGAVVPRVEYRRELEARARRLALAGRLVFAGLRHDVPEVLSEVTVSVLPSLSEGLSNVLLESMAAGVPVVATRVGGNPEVVEDERTGLLVPPRDPGALAGAICAVLERPGLAAGFRAAGLRRVADQFSKARMVDETERCYLDLLDPAH